MITDKQMTIEAYITEKIRMLKNDFMIKLTREDIAHLKSLKREIDVDHYACDLIMKR